MQEFPLIVRAAPNEGWIPAGVPILVNESMDIIEPVFAHLVHMTANPGSVLLLDEPDAHLEILRQRQIYQVLSETADESRSQIIAASHSEVMLDEAAGRDVLIAFRIRREAASARQSWLPSCEGAQGHRLRALRAGGEDRLGALLASAVPKVRGNGRCEDVIFFDGVFFEPSLKSIFFVS